MDDPVAATVDTYGSVADQYRARNADRCAIEDFLDRFLDALDGTRVLDVGCGPGWETATFAERGYDPIGVDLTPAFLRMATDVAPDGSFTRMDMRRLGVTDDSVDGLWACASFLHVPRSDSRSTLAEFHRVLRSGGTLALAVKRGEGEQSGSVYEDDERRFTLYTADALHERLQSAGFTIVDMNVADEWIQFVATA